MTDLFLCTESARVAEIYRCKAVEAQRKTDAPLRARIVQNLTMDIGLFSDSATQLDLVDMTKRGK